MRHLFQSALLLCFLFIGTTSFAQNGNITADDILSSYYENTGAEHWASLTSTRTTGKALMQGIEYPFIVTLTRPNKIKVVSDFNGMEYIEAYDGTTAWTVNPFMGSTEAQKKNEDETTEAAKDMFEDELYNYKEKGHSVSLEGEEEVNGAKTYKLKLVTKDGDEKFYFFDQENFVPIMMRETIQSGQMKGMPVESHLGNYDEVEIAEDKIMYMPFEVTQKVNGQTMMTMTMEKVESNIEIEDAFFSFPEKK